MSIDRMNYIPGQSETISAVSVGYPVLNEWTYFKLDGHFKFEMANVSLSQGGSAVPTAAYELAIDNTWTENEADYSGDTLYAMFRIIDDTYDAIETFVSGKNYGSMVDNEAVKSWGQTVTSPAGIITPFAGITLPTGWQWIRKDPATKSRATYDGIWDAFGNVDWYAPDAASAAAAETAGNFYFPGLRDLSFRGPAIHGAATFANATNKVTVTDISGDVINDDWRDGTPIRFIGGTMPTGITEYTTYYLGWDGSGAWFIYDTEANAITNDESTGLITFTTDGADVYATQLGITLPDAMQGHWHQYRTSSGAGTDAGFGVGSLGTMLPFTAAYAIQNAIADGTNGTPRTSNESRGRGGFMRMIIKE